MNETPTPVELEPAPFTVVGDNIVVEMIEKEEVLESGIVLAGVERKRPPEVTVVGVGPLAQVEVFAVSEREPDGRDTYFADKIPVCIGDVLVVRKHEMLRVELGDDERELHILKPAAVIGIVE